MMQQDDLGMSPMRLRTGSYKILSLKMVAVLSMFGSFFYIFSPTMSFLNLFAFALAPFFLYILTRGAVNLSGVLYFSALFFFLTLTVLIMIAEPSLAATREFRNIVAAIYVSTLALVCINLSPRFAFSIARLSFYLLSAIALLQVLHEFFGIGVPAKLDETWRMYGQTQFEIGYPSVFGNPNDFGAFVLCYLLVVLVVKRTEVSSDKSLLIDLVFIAAMLILSGSKSAIAMSVLGLAFYSKVTFLFILLSAIGVSTWMNSSETGLIDIESDLYAVRRILIDVDLFLSGTAGESLSVRAGSHLFFIFNPGVFFFGSFSLDPVCPQFLTLGGEYLLIAYNPHSFIIGTFCSFGVLAVPFFALLALSSLSPILRVGSSLFFSFYMIAVLLVATSISSWFLSNTQIIFLLVLAFTAWSRPKRVRS